MSDVLDRDYKSWLQWELNLGRRQLAEGGYGDYQIAHPAPSDAQQTLNLYVLWLASEASNPCHPRGNGAACPRGKHDPVVAGKAIYDPKFVRLACITRVRAVGDHLKVELSTWEAVTSVARLARATFMEGQAEELPPQPSIDVEVIDGGLALVLTYRPARIEISGPAPRSAAEQQQIRERLERANAELSRTTPDEELTLWAGGALPELASKVLRACPALTNRGRADLDFMRTERGRGTGRGQGHTLHLEVDPCGSDWSVHDVLALLRPSGGWPDLPNKDEPVDHLTAAFTAAFARLATDEATEVLVTEPRRQRVSTALHIQSRGRLPDRLPGFTDDPDAEYSWPGPLAAPRPGLLEHMPTELVRFHLEALESEIARQQRWIDGHDWMEEDHKPDRPWVISGLPRQTKRDIAKSLKNPERSGDYPMLRQFLLRMDDESDGSR